MRSSSSTSVLDSHRKFAELKPDRHLVIMSSATAQDGFSTSLHKNLLIHLFQTATVHLQNLKLIYRVL